MSRSKAAYKFILSSGLIQIVIVISGLILPPLIISEYGSEVNGLINTIKQLVTYFTVVSLGLGITSQVALYKPLNNNDWCKINGILSATHYFFKKTGIVFAILVFITAILFPYLGNPDIPRLTIFLIITIYGIGAISEYILISKYRILLASDQKQNIISNIQSIGIIFTTIFSVILIYSHVSIIYIILISTISYLIRLFLTINYVKKKYPNVNFTVDPDFSALDGKWQAFSYQIANMIINYTPIILVAVFFGLVDASIFSVYNMIFFSLTMITAIFSAGFSASFGNLIVENDLNKLLNAFNIYELIYRNIMFIVYTIAFITTASFMSIYITNSDGVNYVIPSLVIAFVFQGIFKSFRIPFVTLVEAVGDFRVNKTLNIYEAILNITLSIILLNYFGFIGVLYGAVIAGLIRSILYVKYTQKIILCSKNNIYFIKIILNIITSILLYIFFGNEEVGGFIDFIYYLLKTSIIVAISFLLLNGVLDFKSSVLGVQRIKKIVLKRI